MRDRAAHAQALLHILDHLPDPARQGLEGVYLSIEGRTGEKIKTSSLNSSGLNLLTVHAEDPIEHVPAQATVFATPKGLAALRRKISEFETEDTPIRDDGTGGRPKNADLVQSIGMIVEASLRELWRGPPEKFPKGEQPHPWEIWLAPEQADNFIAKAAQANVVFSTDRLEFPEDVVVLATATREVLARAIKQFGCVKALAAPQNVTELFRSMPIEEQDGWMDDLLRLVTYSQNPNSNYVTLLDTGISLAHPLISPALDPDDRHAARPGWDIADHDGHGTELAGLALFGDLTSALQARAPIDINYRLESGKIIPDAGGNPHHLLGAITRSAIDAVETRGDRRRTFAMATTTEDDTPHDGAPTSWSGALDLLSAGAAGNRRISRLILVSAGNTPSNRLVDHDYLPVCDHEDNELESPAHAWNVIAVGAYTTKTVLPAGQPFRVLAEAGDLSPSSRTASWFSHWPIKPDVVLEGGNWVKDAHNPPFAHDGLQLLTTAHNYPATTFTTTGATSGATALAAKAISELWADYPDLWPETIRALFVNSARWTPRMLTHLGERNPPLKGSYDPLFTRYGYGVPDLGRARRSAANALSLIIQDTITPYKASSKSGANHTHNEMKVFELPWPTEALRALGATQVTLRVALSTFIVPNPSEPARGSKFGYASHNLRFKLNWADEQLGQFLGRISKIAEDEAGPEIEGKDGWDFGSNRRDVGSLHIDQLTCPASDLARRNLLAVHPVTGWWKAKGTSNPEQRSARFALIVEIDTGTVDADIYTETKTKADLLLAQKVRLDEAVKV